MLGLAYCLGEDVIEFKFGLMDNDCAFTHRAVLSLVQGWYNPLGLIGPALMQGKLMLRELHGPDVTWNSDLTSLEKRSWALWLEILGRSEPVIFPRFTRPRQAVCATVYIVWEKKDGTYKARLLMSKCRLTSLHGTMNPRAELQALVVLFRLLLVAAVNLTVPVKRVGMSTNIEAVIAGHNKVYWTNRTSEKRGSWRKS